MPQFFDDRFYSYNLSGPASESPAMTFSFPRMKSQHARNVVIVAVWTPIAVCIFYALNSLADRASASIWHNLILAAGSILTVLLASVFAMFFQREVPAEAENEVDRRRRYLEELVADYQRRKALSQSYPLPQVLLHCEHLTDTQILKMSEEISSHEEELKAVSIDDANRGYKEEFGAIKEKKGGNPLGAAGRLMNRMGNDVLAGERACLT